jgi:hypothetical protein
MPQSKLPVAKKLKMTVAKVDIQPATGHIDRIIDALVLAWNEQEYDKQAFDYFMGMTWEKPEVLIASLYRYPEGNRVLPGDREFLARRLKELADAMYVAVARWM